MPDIDKDDNARHKTTRKGAMTTMPDIKQQGKVLRAKFWEFLHLTTVKQQW